MHEDIASGAVWLLDPHLGPRSVVKITNISNRVSTFCEALQIDDNFANGTITLHAFPSKTAVRASSFQIGTARS